VLEVYQIKNKSARIIILALFKTLTGRGVLLAGGLHLSRNRLRLGQDNFP
jgi:hypothetical protein